MSFFFNYIDKDPDCRFTRSVLVQLEAIMIKSRLCPQSRGLARLANMIIYYPHLHLLELILMVNLDSISSDVTFGKNVKLSKFINLYGCSIGDNTKIGAFVEIQKNASIGANCKISSHSFVCEGVTIEDGVFVGHGVMFTNDKYPRSVNPDGSMQTEENWEVIPTLVKKGASIGTGAVIICGITIGENALVGAGAVVTKNVPDGATVVGVPTKTG